MQSDASDRRDGVTDAGYLLVATVSIGERGTGERSEHRERLVRAVEGSELESREAELEGEEERNHRVDHLRGDVGEEAREAQPDDVRAHDRSPAPRCTRSRFASPRSNVSERRIQTRIPSVVALLGTGDDPASNRAETADKVTERKTPRLRVDACRVVPSGMERARQMVTSQLRRSPRNRPDQDRRKDPQRRGMSNGTRILDVRHRLPRSRLGPACTRSYAVATTRPIRESPPPSAHRCEPSVRPRSCSSAAPPWTRTSACSPPCPCRARRAPANSPHCTASASTLSRTVGSVSRKTSNRSPS